MKEYVVVHTRRMEIDGPFDYALLILKNKPAWQAGRLNLLGGKVEEGEDAIACAVRELKEESGLVGSNPLYCGTIIALQSMIHCVRLDVDDWTAHMLEPGAGETEKVDWFTLQDAFKDDRLMPNLKVIIPLMHMGLTGWTITDQHSSAGKSLHDVTISIPIGKPFTNEPGK